MNEILEHKRNYDADKKLADHQCLEKMLQTSAALLDREATTSIPMKIRQSAA